MAEGVAEVLVGDAAGVDSEGEETKDHRQKSLVRLIVDVYLLVMGVMSHLVGFYCCQRQVRFYMIVRQIWYAG